MYPQPGNIYVHPFPRSTIRTEEFLISLHFSIWFNKNCPRSVWSRLIFSSNFFIASKFEFILSPRCYTALVNFDISSLGAHLISLFIGKISQFQGGRRGAVQRCLPSFQQRRWRYFPKLDFLSVGCNRLFSKDKEGILKILFAQVVQWVGTVSWL